MIKRKILLGFALGAICAVGATYVVHEVRAAGAPSENPLVYSGVLEQDGVPADGAFDISVRLWDAASAGDKLCETTPGSPTDVEDGNFQVTLDEECVSAVSARANVWLQLVVNGDSLGRTKINAVPYALEAKNAVSVGSFDEGKLTDINGKLESLPTITRYKLYIGDGLYTFTDQTGVEHVIVGLGPDNNGDSHACFEQGTTKHGYFKLGVGTGGCSLFLRGANGPAGLSMPAVTYGIGTTTLPSGCTSWTGRTLKMVLDLAPGTEFDILCTDYP